MANPAESEVQNLLPVQAYFSVDGTFQTFIGQGQPFTATISPIQSGLQITNSTINSSPIGAITPSTGAFTNISTTTGTISSAPSGPTSIVNQAYVDSVAQGLSFKQPALVASVANIPTLSGLLTIDGVTLVAGDRVLVKNQATQADNGIYVAASGAWARAADANTWDELLAAYLFILEGSVWKGSAWVCTDVPGGTLGVTAVTFVQFSNNATYTAGTGLTLTGFQFSLTNTAVTPASYGSATQSAVIAVNAQGQVTSASNSTITPAVGSITGLGTGVATWLATPSSANLASAVSDETGTGALVFANSPTLVTPILGTPASGDFSTGTFTWPTFNQSTTGNAASATNLAGGASGNVPYQTASGATTFLATGSNGQVLTLASGVPSWATPTTGTVTSVSGTGTVNGLTLTGTVTSSGSLTLGGTLDLSSPPAIGGTTANTVRGTTVTATSSFVGTNFDASGSGGGSLRTNGGSACLQWGGGGGVNVTIDGPINMNGANAAIQINPTGTGSVSIAPAGAVTVNPTTASTMNNVAIGGTTPLAGTFTDLRFNGTLSAAGSTGTAGFVMTSNGASAPTWQALPASGITITDDTTTNATRYLAFTSATSGSITGQNVSSTKLQFNPSTGSLTSTAFVGNGSSLTNLNAASVTTGVLAQANGGTGTTVGYNGFKNRIINGDMAISQRNVTTATTTADAYPVDRFQIANNSAATFSAVQSTTAPAGFTNSFSFTVTSADTSVTGADRTFIRQRIEGFNIADLAWGSASASSVTVSFWVRSSVTGTFGGSILNNDENRSYAFTYTISSANTWEQKSVTIPGDTTGTWLTNNGRGMNLLFSLGMGSDLTTSAGSWTAGQYYSATGCTNLISTNSATFFITGVQLEKGSTATSFDVLPYTTELALCQRYFCKTYNINTAPGSTGQAAGNIRTSVQATNSYTGFGYWSFPVSMRANPTMTVYSPGNGAIRGFLGDGAEYSPADPFDPGHAGCAFYVNNVSIGTSTFIAIQATASAEL
jgi:hypothetical protein